MATSTLIPISEYLSTTYRPDCDYIDGGLQERNVGDIPHSFLQGLLITFFNANRRQWHLVAGTEARMQVSPTRFRIPDVTIMRDTDHLASIVQTPPLICIEVLSPRDTLASMQERVRDYLRMGVEHIWLIDPITHDSYIADATGLHAPTAGEFSIPNSSIRLVLAELFAELDDMLTPKQ